MGRKRQPELQPWRNVARGRLYTQPATETTYLGGLTLPQLTRRPHMGPFNYVTPYKLSDADEVYRQHDIGYATERAAGRSPYTKWNKYDQQLLDAPAYGWPDYIAKGFFGLKKLIAPKDEDPKPVAQKSPKDERRVNRGIARQNTGYSSRNIRSTVRYTRK